MKNGTNHIDKDITQNSFKLMNIVRLKMKRRGQKNFKKNKFFRKKRSVNRQAENPEGKYRQVGKENPDRQGTEKTDKQNCEHASW